MALLGAFIDNTGTPDCFDNSLTYSSSQVSKFFLLRTNSSQSYPDCFANSKILCNPYPAKLIVDNNNIFFLFN
jgi:hypothetical protein